MMGGLMDKERERYLNEPRFRAAVDMVRGMLRTGMLTTHDAARACVFACQMHIEQDCGPITVVLAADGSVRLEESEAANLQIRQRRGAP